MTMFPTAMRTLGRLRSCRRERSGFTHASALFATAGAQVIDVPFGEGQAVVNLLGSRIEGVVQLPAALVSHVKNGDLRVLAVLGSKRDPVFPDVPAANELGYSPAEVDALAAAGVTRLA